MKKINNTITGFAFILIFTSFSLGAWENQDVGFPEDIQVSAISVVDDNIVWAVGGRALSSPFFQGISMTMDGGESWENSTITVSGIDLTEYITVDVFALSDSLAWVVMAYDTVLPHKGLIVKTVDSGATWVAQSSAYPDTLGLHNGPDFIHFFDENNGITVGDLEEMYSSSDGGDNWTKIPLSNYPAILDNEDPYNASYCTMGDSSLAFGTNAGRVFRTSDLGASWIASNVGLGQTFIWTTFQDEMIGLATAPVVGTAIAKTVDGGITWTTLSSALPTNAILSHQKGTESTYMYGSSAIPFFIGSDPGTGFTSDFGNTWYDQDDVSRLPTMWSDSTTGWSGGLDNLIHKWNEVPESSDPNWVAQDPGYPEDMSVFSQHVVNEDLVWTIGGRRIDKPVYHGFSKTTDGGETWNFGEITNAGLNNYFLTHVFAIDENIAWITLADNISSPIQGRIYKTTDGGTSWVHQSTAYPNSSSQAESSNFVHFFDEDNGVTVGDFRNTYVTSNGGDSWTLISNTDNPALLTGEEPSQSNYSAVGESTLYYATNKGRVFATHDRGLTWTVSATGFGSTIVWASFQNEMVGLATAPLTGEGTGIAKTEDGGVTWFVLDETLPTPSILVHVKGTDETYMYGAGALPLFIEGASYGSGFTSDFGETWEFQNELHFMPGNFADHTVGWTAALDNMFYKYVGPPLPIYVSIDNGLTHNPDSYSLSQNFPNPFNPSTTILFELDTPGYVSLEVFDVRGSRVITLTSDQRASGLHEVTFDASHLASGTYIYRLSTKTGSISRKMLLIK